ncbi:hypothetical protein QQS21_011574 [Conoideocrella luteorostrata]|uniref:CENP-V/GFA domain-containing protein n=1 Tax=Conoideocrella luteorostrata TaxID=1105319 RepID=A0AAJ0FNG5_9HYPO|nr:hypothetical protein QQS21_011574 [Conoideocrella luteorostrata]
MATNQSERRTYRGNCHCKAFVYEAQLPEIKSVKECNCSICHKKGYLWVFAQSVDDFKIVRGDENTLKSYTFNTMKLVHKFCPTCATPVMAVAVEGPVIKTMALNVHALQNVNTWELQKDTFDGAAKLEPQYVVPEHKGPEPTAEVQGGKVYKGGCHCGAVTVAVISKPLDETFESDIVECDCSICEKNGYIWTYPSKDQVVLHAEDASNIGRYAFSMFVLNKTFCKICGVNLTNEYKTDRTKEQEANMSEGAKKWAERGAAMHPVNLRVLPEVDVNKLKRYHNKGSTGIPPMYENP